MATFYRDCGSFANLFFSEGDERIAASLIETSDDPLWKIEQLVDFEALRPVIEEKLRAFKPLCLGYKSASTLSSRNGRPALDPLLMFKIVFIQMQFNLSDHAVVVQIKDRVSFRRFLNISYDLVPGASTPKGRRASSIPPSRKFAFNTTPPRRTRSSSLARASLSGWINRLRSGRKTSTPAGPRREARAFSATSSIRRFALKPSSSYRSIPRLLMFTIFRLSLPCSMPRTRKSKSTPMQATPAQPKKRSSEASVQFPYFARRHTETCL